jgi:peptidyl-prolyl cis-trans isomerase D
MMGEQFDQKLFDTPEAKQAVLDQPGGRTRPQRRNRRNHLTVSDRAAEGHLAIQAFRKPDGSFDMDAYKAALAAQGMTPEMFDQRMRHDLAVQQLAGSVQQTAFAPRASRPPVGHQRPEREVQELVFPAANYASQVKVTDDMVKAFYDKNATLFQVPESVKAEYVVFDASAVEKQVNVSRRRSRRGYNKNKARFITPEQRTASHILITSRRAPSRPRTPPPRPRRSHPGRRAQEPERLREDRQGTVAGPGLGRAGRRPGRRQKGVFVKPVEDAIYSLKEGEVSGLVRSEFGYHIIKITSVAPESQKSLEAAKPEITAELKKAKMSAKYTELAETFNVTPCTSSRTA